jgi:hypothetical protein
MWAVMKCEGWAARRGRRVLIEAERATGGEVGVGDGVDDDVLAGADCVATIEEFLEVVGGI